MDGRIAVILNLAVQALLIVAVIVAAVLAKRRRLTRHCTIMKIAVAVQVLAIFAFMLSPMLSYIKYEQVNALLIGELWIHHSLGLAVIVFWSVILAIRVTARDWRLALMRLAFISWILTMFIGLHLYATIWLSL
jgi:hypothetical protein